MLEYETIVYAVCDNYSECYNRIDVSNYPFDEEQYYAAKNDGWRYDFMTSSMLCPECCAEQNLTPGAVDEMEDYDT